MARMCVVVILIGKNAVLYIDFSTNFQNSYRNADQVKVKTKNNSGRIVEDFKQQFINKWQQNVRKEMPRTHLRQTTSVNLSGKKTFGTNICEKEAAELRTDRSEAQQAASEDTSPVRAVHVSRKQQRFSSGISVTKYTLRRKAVTLHEVTLQPRWNLQMIQTMFYDTCTPGSQAATCSMKGTLIIP